MQNVIGNVKYNKKSFWTADQICLLAVRKEKETRVRLLEQRRIVLVPQPRQTMMHKGSFLSLHLSLDGDRHYSRSHFAEGRFANTLSNTSPWRYVNILFCAAYWLWKIHTIHDCTLTLSVLLEHKTFTSTRQTLSIFIKHFSDITCVRKER